MYAYTYHKFTAYNITHEKVFAIWILSEDSALINRYNENNAIAIKCTSVQDIYDIRS